MFHHEKLLFLTKISNYPNRTPRGTGSASWSDWRLTEKMVLVKKKLKMLTIDHVLVMQGTEIAAQS